MCYHLNIKQVLFYKVIFKVLSVNNDSITKKNFKNT